MPTNISALICDDIRQESNGKMFLIGTIVEKMIVHSFPFENVFDCLIRFRGLKSDAKFVDVTLQHVGFKSETTRFEFPSVVDGYSTMVIFQFPFKAKNEGQFKLLVSVDDGPRRCIEALKVVIQSEDE